MPRRDYRLTFLGVRGSTAVPGAGTLRYGGNTACAIVPLGAARWLILDCGTGLRSLQAKLPSRSPDGDLQFDVFFSHYHWDHIQGLPFFPALYDPGCRFTFHGHRWGEKGVRALLAEALRPPWFPVAIDETASSKSFVDLDDNPLTIGELTIRSARLHHRQGVTAYRLEHPGGALVFATDVESDGSQSDAELVRLAVGAGVLILDAQHRPEEFDSVRGQGHGTWAWAVEIARRAEVGQLILFHHAPERSDDQIEEIVSKARKLFANTIAAREGSSVDF